MGTGSRRRFSIRTRTCAVSPRNTRAGSNATSTVTPAWRLPTHHRRPPASTATAAAHTRSAAASQAAPSRAAAAAIPNAARRRSRVSVAQPSDDSVGTGTDPITSRRISSAVRSRIRASVVGTMRWPNTGSTRVFTSSGST